MINEIRKVLLKYWGYHSFRPLQEDIILSILEGKDTLALLPTGGGKSICFQVPALYKEGICIVITPLIALMKDQVNNLKNKQIKAAAIYSGMHKNEIDIALDNAIYGDLKFLYVSPERLESELFRERLEQMNVSLLAVDEAHCISQWGYDFRPPYLKIAEARQLIPGVPVLALTATATPVVVEDIQQKLEFRDKNVFQKSFSRSNLAYMVRKSEDKFGKMIRMINKHPGTGIIYVRNRRRTKEVAEYLSRQNIKADFYHAGLDPATRERKQDEWIHEKTKVMVSTNAFGMGIDKPNVRFVVHLDLPDSLEAYFQEAGRAGRDEQESVALMIFDDSDVSNSRRNFENSFPPRETIKSVYQALGNYFQLAEGSGKDLSFDFDLHSFCETYRLSPVIVYSSIKFLEKEGYILMNESFHSPSKLFIPLNHEDLYRFQVENPKFDPFIKLILRLYPGLFSEYVRVNENEIALKGDIKKELALKYLNTLTKYGIMSYLPSRSKPQIVFLKERLDIRNLLLSSVNYEERKTEASKRMEAVINFASETTECRSRMLLSYFGEDESQRCGKCDVCLNRNKMNINDLEFNSIEEKIGKLVRRAPQSIQEITFELDDFAEEIVIEVVRWMEEGGKIIKNDEHQYEWRKQFRLFR